MQISQRGINFIKGWEGFSETPYRDAGGYPTIGYGHLIGPGESFTRISRQEGEDLLRKDLQIFVRQVNNVVKVPLTQAMFDALVSLAFNWGRFPESSHLKYLNSGNYQRTGDRIGEHPITSAGKTVQGLINRRKAEKDLFFSEGLPGADVAQNNDPQDTEYDPGDSLFITDYVSSGNSSGGFWDFLGNNGEDSFFDFSAFDEYGNPISTGGGLPLVALGIVGFIFLGVYLTND